MYRLSDQQFEAVRKLSVEKRYVHLVKRAGAMGELWSLRAEDGWVVGADESGREFVPVWPHPRYAEAAADGAWATATPAPISTSEWLERRTADLTRLSRLVGVFPVEGGPNAVIDPEAFAADLLEELALVE